MHINAIIPNYISPLPSILQEDPEKTVRKLLSEMEPQRRDELVQRYFTRMPPESQTLVLKILFELQPRTIGG